MYKCFAKVFELLLIIKDQITLTNIIILLFRMYCSTVILWIIFILFPQFCVHILYYH